MNQTLSLGFSTCPNDTYAFYALAHNLIDSGGLAFQITLADVETLNQEARRGGLDISKLSIAAVGRLQGKYRLLRSGAALGRGCGPLVVARPGLEPNRLLGARIAVPGMWTSAFMFLSLYLGAPPRVTALPFERIMPAVARGDFDFGVIIHEGRFTYADHGLASLVDLGEWWEEETRLPIPLGGIAIRSDHTAELAARVDRAVRESVVYARTHAGAADRYVSEHAQELAPEVIRQHIELYVNDFTVDLGRQGRAAVERFFAMAEARGILPPSSTPLFAWEEAG
jgi:1,4-dihydroxy-6-naphthoate synthase